MRHLAAPGGGQRPGQGEPGHPVRGDPVDEDEQRRRRDRPGTGEVVDAQCAVGAGEVEGGLVGGGVVEQSYAPT